MSDRAAHAQVFLVALLWGLNWLASKFALADISPWFFRTLTFGVGAGNLMLASRWWGTSMAIAKGMPRLHLAVAGILNIGGFGIFSAFALLETSVARTSICAYTMPIWTTLLARIVLEERLTRARTGALVTGTSGLAVLLWPLFAEGIPIGALYALGAAVSWSAGTVYLKWSGVQGHPLAIAAWQLVAGTCAVTIGFLVDGADFGNRMDALSAAGLIYGIFLGTALAYLLWFNLVGRLSASAAAMGTLMVPVVGVLASIGFGERPDEADLVGFALIFVASLLALWPAGSDRKVTTRNQARAGSGT
ncbi:DMT family transporter [Tianweitania sediminis]|uniref:DMT family transporter n=1 Tax=Tianweitania sediminis TaxID=1502156 RepID=A0A8J7QY11_9HYPH|nr:DMT family transporter [Tianweitania sediminis]MBP0437990.1 DMT family transporter [Tianweitania sediminis]